MNGIALLEQAYALEGTLHNAGVRGEYRTLLERGIALVSKRLESTCDISESTRFRKLLVQAHAARAEDARYGVGALSRSAQRAPTLKDCEEGWRKVAMIVDNARESADKARRLASEVGEFRTGKLVERAERAANLAESTLAARNRAYTFFTTPGFSFGEGWYLAAASLFAELPIQVRTGTPQERQALQFLKDVGLAKRLMPYRPRPASPKHLTDIIATTFERDPQAARKKLRDAFLGQQPASAPIVEWLKGQMGTDIRPKVLLWTRISDHDPHRNTAFDELACLGQLIADIGVTPVFFGDAIPNDVDLSGGIDLTLCWKKPLFQTLSMRRDQLQLFEVLRSNHHLVGQIGVTTAGMDGPALMGLPTAYLTDEPNVRLGKWVGKVPGYEEVVRDSDYLVRLQDHVLRWQQAKSADVKEFNGTDNSGSVPRERLYLSAPARKKLQ